MAERGSLPWGFMSGKTGIWESRVRWKEEDLEAFPEQEKSTEVDVRDRGKNQGGE